MGAQDDILESPQRLLLRLPLVALILMGACGSSPEERDPDARIAASIVEGQPIGRDEVEVTSVIENLTDDSFDVECEIVVHTSSGESGSVMILVIDLRGGSEDRVMVKIPVEDASGYDSGASRIDCMAR